MSSNSSSRVELSYPKSNLRVTFEFDTIICIEFFNHSDKKRNNNNFNKIINSIQALPESSKLTIKYNNRAINYLTTISQLAELLLSLEESTEFPNISLIFGHKYNHKMSKRCANMITLGLPQDIVDFLAVEKKLGYDVADIINNNCITYHSVKYGDMFYYTDDNIFVATTFDKKMFNKNGIHISFISEKILTSLDEHVMKFYDIASYTTYGSSSHSEWKYALAHAVAVKEYYIDGKINILIPQEFTFKKVKVNIYVNYSHLETIIVSRDRLTDVIRTVQAHLYDSYQIKNALSKY